jgi:2'-5' RNA ligase
MERFFIAFIIDAPWPRELPAARLLEPEERHLTLAFIGKDDRERVVHSFQTLARHPLPFGFCGYFDSILFLPKNSSRVIAYHAQIPNEEELNEFVGIVHQRMSLDMPRKWLPHVTMGRSPFEKKEWEKSFAKIPFNVSSLGLFESIGNLRYKLLSEISLVPMIERVEHTADIAFLLRGKTVSDLFRHALISLAFDDMGFLSFLENMKEVSSIDEIIIELNRFVRELDTERGCPFKAVSFHGALKKVGELYEWEMIVDV